MRSVEKFFKREFILLYSILRDLSFLRASSFLRSSSFLTSSSFLRSSLFLRLSSFLRSLSFLKSSSSTETDHFYRKAGRTKHIKACKGTGNFTRSDITAYICSDCGYIAKSSKGLTQHRQQGTNCLERTRSMSRLELSVTTVRSKLTFCF